MSGYDATTHLSGAALDRYLDGDLASAETAAAESHLAACSACRLEVRRYRALFFELATLPIAVPPPDFDARILAAILPGPGADAALVKLATRGYLAVSVFLIGFVGTLFATAAARSGSVQGTTASGLSAALDFVMRVLSGAGNAVLSFLISVGDAAAPVLTAFRPIAGGLMAAATAVAPSLLPIVLACMLVATGILLWAVHTPQERRVPHGSLSL